MSDSPSVPHHSDAADAQLARLQQCCDQLPLREAADVRKRLSALRRRVKQGQPVDRSLTALQAQCDASLQHLEARLSRPITLQYPPELPVSARHDEILKLLEAHQVVVIAGETGSGKTTQIPKLCLEAGSGRRGLIGHTQPRRLAARNVAARLAEELQVPLGETVGFQMRFADNTNEHTRIKLMTDGILLAEIQHDPQLLRYDTLIIDEAHERSLNIDFLLGYLRQLIQRRHDLKIVITSATIDVERFAEHFADPRTGKPAPIIEVSGRTYPVETRYRPLMRDSAEESDLTLQEGILEAVEEIAHIEREKRWFTGQRDILVFLPGEREIRETAETLRKAQLRDTEILPLYARLSVSEQQRIFSPSVGRRIVLATNVAETSLTVPGIRYVIDPGLARISRYSPRAKVQRLPIEPISQASAEQRKGRCGRISEGACIRLYSEDDFILRPAFTEPEIRRTNLAAVILSMLALRLGNIEAFPFLEPPESRAVRDGFRLLNELGAVDSNDRLTPLGRKLARLPIDPRLARMVLAGAEFKALQEVLIVVSALAVQDPRERPADQREAADQKHREWADKDSDFVSWLNLWNGFATARDDLSSSALRRWCRTHFLSYMRLREWHDTFRQLRQLAQELKLGEVHPRLARDEEGKLAIEVDGMHRALLTGLLSNLGLHLENREYLGARNRRFMIHPGSGLSKRTPKWIMAAEMLETTRLYAREVSGIKPQWIEPTAGELVKRSYSEPHWEKKRAQVVAYEQVTLFGLPIVTQRKVHYGPIAPQESREIFIRSALVEGEFRTQGKFFAHNRALIGEVEALEDKARRRDILVDEEALFAFYDERIPDNITNGASFERWRKDVEHNAPEALFFDLNALMAREAEEVTDQRYPERLMVADMQLPLSYHFAPGASDDGVTVSVPAVMLSTLPREALDWLVPGLRRDKGIALMKSLPKALRRQVVPIPDWVDAALEALTPGQTYMTEALGEFLRRRTGVRLSDEDWHVEQLPPHLVMNIRVLDHKGKVLGEGRDLDVLIARFERQAEEGAAALADSRQPRTGLTAWPSQRLPERERREQAGIRVEAYPALVDEGDSLGVVLFDHPGKAHEQHRHGVKRAAMQALPEQVRYFTKSMPKLDRCALLFTKVGSRQALASDIVDALFLRAFSFDPLPRSADEMAERIEARRGDLGELADMLADEVEAALKGYLDVTKKLKGNVSLQLARAYSDLKAQMARLVHPGFVVDAGEWLSHYPRYMQAALLRLEKLGRDYRRDTVAMQEIHDFEARWDARRQSVKGALDPALAEFRWWIEELRVSLFAQQLGTLDTVSVKRLERRWQEIIAGE
ncbi:ATP-dependent RNA helicase HrpA [Zymobacter sp. IVIA_5232.4 C2]|uniref:ATP-dependent RNA helicase HrpA n=1 Tax=Zymobacter sp. IVIA_5232.4 C2 TaxID=3394855 RepID=UPI0039C0A2AF